MGRKFSVAEPIKTMIRSKDLVQVITGRDGGRVTAPGDAERDKARQQGKRGRVRQVDRRTGRVVVDGVHIVHRHERPNPKKGHRGGRVDKEAPIALASVRLVCPGCDRAVRVKPGRDDKGRLTRVCRECGVAF
ncbi:MAG TPA: 50S ribosomal protein L24 [Planctomycetota bacterium]|nr:50S ribosomal protein L24 [Planctomycetota bacterium]